MCAREAQQAVKSPQVMRSVTLCIADRHLPPSESSHGGALCSINRSRCLAAPPRYATQCFYCHYTRTQYTIARFQRQSLLFGLLILFFSVVGASLRLDVQLAICLLGLDKGVSIADFPDPATRLSYFVSMHGASCLSMDVACI